MKISISSRITEQSDNKECARCKQQQTIRHVPASVSNGRNNLVTQQGAGAQGFSHKGDANENNAIA